MQSVSWREPYWPYHAVATQWMIRFSPWRVLRMLLVAGVTFGLASVVLFMILRDVYSRIFPLCALGCVLFMVAFFLGALIYTWIVPFLCWLTRPLISVSTDGVRYRLPGAHPVHVTMDDLISLSVDTSTPGQGSITVKWRGGEKVIGIPSDLDLISLEELIGRKYERVHPGSPPSLQRPS